MASERMELAKLCSSRDWSKAIRILDSLLSQSCAIQDLWFVFFVLRSLNLFGNWSSIDLVTLNLASLLFVFSNRAFCYSRLELHKHVIKDCDKALQLDPMLLQAYILKGIIITIFLIFSIFCVRLFYGLVLKF